MEKNDIEEIFSLLLVDGMTMAPVILMIWKNNEGRFFEFRMRITREYQQDLSGIHKDSLDIPKDLILDYPENNKEVDFEYLLLLCKKEGTQFGSSWGQELNKKLIPHVRSEKLNKLI